MDSLLFLLLHLRQFLHSCAVLTREAHLASNMVARYIQFHQRDRETIVLVLHSTNH